MKDIQKYVPQQEVSVVVTTEQKELIASATKFAEYLTDHWPQTTNEGAESKINYYISGSLASMLLSCADKFIEMDEAKIPVLMESIVREIPESARNFFASFARQIGDLDYVRTNEYKNNPTSLRKGGGGPSFEEIPEEGRMVLKQKEGQIKVMCDPVENYGTNKIAKINVDGRDYFIARPDTIFAYKVLHLLQSYEQKPEKFNTDFGRLHDALKEIYSEEELAQITNQILVGYEEEMKKYHVPWNGDYENFPVYEKKIPKWFEKVLANQQISPDIRATIGKLKNIYKL